MAVIIEDDETPDVATSPSDFVAPDVKPGDGLRCIVCEAEGVYTPLVRTHARGAPPKYCDEHRKGPKSSGGGVSGGRATNTDKLVAGIKQLYMQLGGVLSFVNAADGMQIAANADTLGESWRGLIERDVNVRKMWEKMLTGSGWSGVIVAHAMVAYPILANHGLVPTPKRAMPNG